VSPEQIRSAADALINAYGLNMTIEAVCDKLVRVIAAVYTQVDHAHLAVLVKTVAVLTIISREHDADAFAETQALMRQLRAGPPKRPAAPHQE